MSGEFDAAGTAIEGALLGAAVEGEKSDDNRADGDESGKCLNCGAALAGPFCGNCGQKAHVHRSIAAVWHDIIHGVLHFDGKMWRTLPMLAFKPGELTRRYIRGERAKFISPMALFLFSIFMMFAVFSFMGSPFSNSSEISGPSGGFVEGVATEAEQLDDQIKQKNKQLETADDAQRLKLTQEILDLKKGRNILATMTGKDLPYPDTQLGDGDAQLGNFDDKDLAKIEDGLGDIRTGNVLNTDSEISTGSPEADKWLKNSLEKISTNPDLLLYKLQSNGYKFAWLLIPLSLPFVWLVTIGAGGGLRKYKFYDHAVFTTYSIAFMSLLFLVCALFVKTGWDGAILGLVIIPPFHLYKQLRHAYQLSRFGALLRLLALFVSIVIVVTLFLLILLFLGILG